MEGWELPTFVGLYGGFVLMGVGLYYKPDTRYFGRIIVFFFF